MTCVEFFAENKPQGFCYPLRKDVEKKQVNVRLTERGIMMLDELADYFGVSKNLVVEWLVTLYHEKMFLLKGGETHEKKDS